MTWWDTCCVASFWVVTIGGILSIVAIAVALLLSCPTAR